MSNGVRISALATAEVIAHIIRLTTGPSFVAGLNPAQWAALRYLGRVGPEARSVTALARYQGTSKGTASQTMAALARKGLVRRVRSEFDRRILRFELTEQGIEAQRHDPIHMVGRAVEALAADEQEQLAKLLEKIARAMSAQRDEIRSDRDPVDRGQ